MDFLSDETLKQIKEATIGWGIPAIFSAVPFVACFDVVASTLRSLGWRSVTAVISMLVFGIVRLLLLWLAEKEKCKTLNEKLKNDYHRYLVPVPGKGVYMDKRNKEIVCPRCVAEKDIPSPMYKLELAFEGWHYICGACQNKVRC